MTDLRAAAQAVVDVFEQPHHLGFGVSARTGTYDTTQPMVKREWLDAMEDATAALRAALDAAPPAGAICGATHPEHPGTTCRREERHSGEHETARRDVRWDNAYLTGGPPAGLREATLEGSWRPENSITVTVHDDDDGWQERDGLDDDSPITRVTTPDGQVYAAAPPAGLREALDGEAALALALAETEGEWRGAGSASWMAKVVWPVMEAHLAAPSCGHPIDEERLTDEIDRHWLERGTDGNGETTWVACSCGSWQWNDAPSNLRVGDVFRPFSAHVAAAIAAAYAGGGEP